MQKQDYVLIKTPESPFSRRCGSEKTPPKLGLYSRECVFIIPRLLGLTSRLIKLQVVFRFTPLLRNPAHVSFMPAPLQAREQRRLAHPNLPFLFCWFFFFFSFWLHAAPEMSVRMSNLDNERDERDEDSHEDRGISECSLIIPWLKHSCLSLEGGGVDTLAKKYLSRTSFLSTFSQQHSIHRRRDRAPYPYSWTQTEVLGTIWHGEWPR